MRKSVQVLLISFRLLGLQNDIEQWWSKNKDLLLPYPIRCIVTEALDEIREMLKNSIRVNANAEVLQKFFITLAREII